ncbi:MAG TPA: SRPBCC domain-containing protein [Ktedonosporobacter sp.]|nr:SRPBCC domain-containing protein [Ktedonosporobacter sp.]
MDIAGNQKIKAPREQVFQAILNPEVLKNSIPGCENAELVDTPVGKQLQLTVAPNFPGFKGPYTVLVGTGEVVPPSRIVLITEPSSSVGTIKAVCTIDLNDDGVGTDLKYNAHADMEGKIAAIPEMMLKPAVKGALDHFFKSFEKHVS